MENKTILVIEDNPLNMKLFCSLLQLGKFNVLKSFDAKTGIELLQKHKPDLILMDIQLPDMDGLSAAKIIKENPVFKSIPIVALTAHAMKGDEQKARGAGCDGYMTKPINTKTFLETITKYLNTKQPEKRNTYYNKKILIVDDEPSNVKLLEAKLPPGEYNVIKAFSGSEAITKVSESPPDLILLDVIMPGIDGFEVVRTLKQNPKTSHIPIIMVTALNDREDKIKAFSIGAEEFISKPVNSIELIKRIESSLFIKKYREQLILRRQSESPLVTPDIQLDDTQDTNIVPSLLIVEDNGQDSKLIESHLHGQPYNLMFAKNGEEALYLLEKNKIDIVLLDVLLPDMSGFEICRQINKMQENINIQIILITCLRDLETKVEEADIRVDDYLIKPIIGRELIYRVKTLFKKKRYLDKISLLNVKHSINDELTKLSSNSYFEHFIKLLVKSALKNNYPVSLILIDIHKLTHINDNFGHIDGNSMLRDLSNVIKKSTRDIDLATRCGSKGFAILLPYCLREEAEKVAKRIHTSYASHPFTHDVQTTGKEILNMKISSFPTDGNSGKELFKNAQPFSLTMEKEELDQVFNHNSDR